MKPNRKKLLVAAAIFPVALNMNGCGTYGPPPHADNDIQKAPVNMEQVLEEESTSVDIGSQKAIRVEKRFLPIADKNDHHANLSIE